MNTIMSDSSNPAESLAQVRREIANACAEAERDPASVTLIAVSKTFPADAIHSVDRSSIAEALAKETARQGRRPQLFVEINTGAEPQKAGVLPQDADAFILTCREDRGLKITGLMCIPPLEEAPAPHFALTAKIAARNGVS